MMKRNHPFNRLVTGLGAGAALLALTFALLLLLPDQTLASIDEAGPGQTMAADLVPVPPPNPTQRATFPQRPPAQEDSSSPVLTDTEAVQFRPSTSMQREKPSANENLVTSLVLTLKHISEPTRPY